MAANRPPSPFTEVSTEVLYEQWADTYDADGNVLQFVDDLELTRLLPQFLALVEEHIEAGSKILDLGCGTGRNTVKLVQAKWSQPVDIEGWDSSEAMLNLARAKCPNLVFSRVDLSKKDEIPSSFTGKYAGIVSTLVLEHLLVKTYFDTVSTLLQPGGYALITNMHEGMGKLSRAGYKTTSGERYKAQSFAHSVNEIEGAVENAGLEIVGSIKERSVEPAVIDGGIVDGAQIEKCQVAERARKWIGVKIWVGLTVRKPL